MNDRDARVIQKMIKYCDDVHTLLEQYEYSFELYETDIAFQYSCNMCIIQKQN